MFHYTLYLYVDEEEMLKGCLQSVFEDNREILPYMTMYVLNGTKTASVEKQLDKYKEACQNRLYYICCEGQKPEQAYKSALKEYSGGERDYIAFLKASTLYREGTLKKMMTQTQTHPGVPVAFAPQYKNRKGTLCRTAR